MLPAIASTFEREQMLTNTTSASKRWGITNATLTWDVNFERRKKSVWDTVAPEKAPSNMSSCTLWDSGMNKAGLDVENVTSVIQHNAMCAFCNAQATDLFAHPHGCLVERIKSLQGCHSSRTPL